MEATISEQSETNQDPQAPDVVQSEVPDATRPLMEPDPSAAGELVKVTPPAPETVSPKADTDNTQVVQESVESKPDESNGDALASPDPVIVSQLIIQPLESPFAQMEAYLVNQLEKSVHYKDLFSQQGNPTLSSQFETYYTLTQKDLELLRQVWKEKSRLPKYKFEAVRVTSTPTNIDIKDKEMRIVVRTICLPVAQDAMTYIVGEFEYPLTGKGESVSQSASRWAHSVTIEPGNLLCCTRKASRQLDCVNSTTVKPFFNRDSGMTEYERALEYYVERGKSRTLKRKFKPVKLTFYEKTGMLKCDKKLGTVQVRVDSINDEATLIMRMPVMNGRKQTDAMADIRVQVREPLVDKSPKTHEEKFLILT